MSISNVCLQKLTLVAHHTERDFIVLLPDKKNPQKHLSTRYLMHSFGYAYPIKSPNHGSLPRGHKSCTRPHGVLGVLLSFTPELIVLNLLYNQQV
jgi:hypothetical protein